MWILDNDVAMRIAKEVTTQMLEQAALTAREGDNERASKLRGHAIKSQSLSRLKAMAELACTEPALVLDATQLDADPLYLGVRNGTIDLKTGMLRDSLPRDYITKSSNAFYDSNAQCPIWLKFLDTVMASDTEMTSFLQRCIGYSLSGETSEQVLFMCHGYGQNGKSLLLNILSSLMGGYAISAQADTLMTKPTGGINNDIARLCGARLVTTSELDDGKRLAEAQVKQLTGGDLITARLLYQEHFQFLPKFKIWMAANHKPTVLGDDKGIWRRIILIPFTVTIPDNERDEKLGEKLQSELNGILSWAIQGCLDWQKYGLNVPAKVRAATGEYKAESDVIGLWLADCCVVDNEARGSGKELYASYKRWIEENGRFALTTQRFNAKLVERQFVKYRSNGIFFKGLKTNY